MSIKIVGHEFDFLGARDRLVEASPTKRICVVTSLKNEGVGLLEWVAHYRAIGIDTLIVYTNDNSDGSEVLLDALGKAGVIHVLYSLTSANVTPLRKAFRHSFWCNDVVPEHEWCSLLDADEFLIPIWEGEMLPIGDWLDRVCVERNPSAIALNWKWFGGGLTFEREDELAMVRFRTAGPNDHVKTVFKVRDTLDVENWHFPRMRPDALAIDGGGDPAGHRPKMPAKFKIGQINHYWNKSFQEFYVKKSRGRGGAMPDAVQRAYPEFFDWGQGADEEVFPGLAHIESVRSELAYLLSLTGVAEAQAHVERKFAEIVAEGARDAFDAELRRRQAEREAAEREAAEREAAEREVAEQEAVEQEAGGADPNPDTNTAS